MKKILNWCILSCFALALAACDKEKEQAAVPDKWLNNIPALYQHNESKITVTRGIAGTLSLREGNCMPIINWESCKEYPVKRTVVLYPYLTQADVEVKDFTYYTPISAKPVRKTETDEEGFYEIQVSPGLYSIFIVVDGKLYANSSDGQGGINPVEVSAESLSKVNLLLNYAVY